MLDFILISSLAIAGTVVLVLASAFLATLMLVGIVRLFKGESLFGDF